MLFAALAIAALFIASPSYAEEGPHCVSAIQGAYKSEMTKLEAEARKHSRLRNWIYRDLDPHIEDYLSQKHLKVSFGYSGLLSFMTYFYIRVKKLGGYVLLTNHFSNPILGIAFVGAVDHSLSHLAPRLRNVALLSTAVMFTLANAAYELRGRPDWTDFYAGEAGLVMYIIVNRVVERLYFTKYNGNSIDR